MKTIKLLASSLAVFFAVMLLGSVAILRVESGAPNANINTMSDAMWWVVNICSVGDAALHPVTAAGRIVGAVLIIVGYGCFTLNVGIVTAIVGHLVRKAERTMK